LPDKVPLESLPAGWRLGLSELIYQHYFTMAAQGGTL